MTKVKIYEIKTGAAPNAPGLLSLDGKYFYWNNTQFSNNEPGDKVFVVNPIHKWALYTVILKMDIPAKFDASQSISTFNHESNTYRVSDSDGRYKMFIQFEIKQKIEIPPGWRWQTILGRFEIYDLWREDISLENIPRRKEKVYDLMKLFPDGNANKILTETLKLLSGPIALNPDIVDAVVEESEKDIYKSKEFCFSKAQETLHEFDNFKEPTEDFYVGLHEKFTNSGLTFSNFLASLTPGDPAYNLFRNIGEIVSYCDKHAARKNEFNQYSDKRTMALVLVHQNEWTNQLLNYKAANNDLNSLQGSIYNAVQYLKYPENGITMLSENHRSMVSKYLLKQDTYNKNTFVRDLIKYFTAYNVLPANPLNLTRTIGQILYEYENVKKLWFERIEGLVVSDNTEWLQKSVRGGYTDRKTIQWWSVNPTKKTKVDKLLPATLREKGFFYLFYTQKNKAVYRARVKDYAYSDNYADKDWNAAGDIINYKGNFDEYKEGDGKFARIAFLVDEFIELEIPIPIERFEFYEGTKPPRHDNLQPYAELDWEEELITPTTVDPKPEPEQPDYLATIKSIAFDHEDRGVLMAIKTKPFILLAGLSGTGKSRLVRKLAYHTCALKELQCDKPGNFLLIPVRPNWHDSMEIMGYVSRISGNPEYIITPFIRFLVKAWKFPYIPFFICLDEMNLAPVEQYFAEFLSLIETRKQDNSNQIATDSLLSYADFKEKALFDELLDSLEIKHGSALRKRFESRGISFPANVIVMGTVNMDETTHSFSRKVLDRAMTFEINMVELKSGLDEVDTAWQYPMKYIGKELLFSEFTFGGQVYNKFPQADQVIEFLEKLNGYLEKTPFKIAYRVRDEFLIYCYHNSDMDNKPHNWLTQCLDELTIMKVLSRIEGDQLKVGRVLDFLLGFLDQKNYPKSASKLEEMKEKLKYGYTSYW